MNAFMRCSIFLAMSFAIGAWAQTQPASQDDIERAIELLRKTPVVPPPSAKSAPPVKNTTAPSNAAPAVATPVRPQAPSVSVPPVSRPQTTPDLATEVFERAKAREEMRKQAVEETRRGLQQGQTGQPGTLAEEQQRKAIDDIERQKNLQRIEMEVQRARLAREQKAAAQAQPAKTNVAAPAVAAAPTNAPAPAVATVRTNVPAPGVVAARTNTPAIAVAPRPAKVPAPKVASTPPRAPVPTPAPVAPQPVKPAPVVPAQPVVPPPQPAVVQQQPAPKPPPPVSAPAPVVVQQTPPPASPPAVAAQPTTGPVSPTFRGLAPDMEQRARDILNQVMENTKGASLPVLATQPPKPAAVIPGPQPPPEPQTATPAPAPVRGPDAPVAPVAATAPPAPSAPITPDQEARAREMLNQLLTRPAVPAPASAPAPVIVEKPRPVPPAPIVTTPTPAAVVTTPAVPPPGVPISRDQEAKARELLNQLLTRPTQAAAPTPVPPTATPTPAPAPIITKAPTAAPQTEAFAPMPSDQEAKAREILNKTLSTMPATASTAPAVAETRNVPENDRRAQDDARRQARLKAEIEEETRREIARMEEESQARAREMAKRRLEDEKRAQRRPQGSEGAAVPTAKPAVGAIRSTPEPAESKPVVKTAEKPRRAVKNSDSKPPVNAPVEETWKDVSKPREQRLAELLEAYRKDQVSPQHYHSERAKILGAP